MRAYKALSLFILLLLATHRIVDCDGVSSLQSIYDDLSILSRVTNAIALESAAIRKSFKVREIISELLHVETGNFSELVKLDPTFLITTLDSLHNISNQVLRSSNGEISSNDLTKTSDLAELLFFIINSLDETTDLNSFGLVERVTKHEDTLLICGTTLVQSLANFSQMLKNMLPNEDLMKNLILEVQQSKNKILNCATRIVDYHKNIGDVKLIMSHFIVLENVRDSIQDVVDENLVGEFPELLVKFQKVFIETMKIMESKEKTGASSMISMATELLKNTIYYEVSEHSHHIVLTAGFPEKEDMTRVISDIKSDWFQEKVSQGKSTEELETSLRPFSEFAKKMRNVEEGWSTFSQSFKKSQEFLLAMAATLTPIEKFQYSGNEEQYLQSISDGFKICSQHFKTNFDKSALKKFDDDLKKFEPYQKIIEAIEEWSADIRNDISIEAFGIFIDELIKKGLRDESAEEAKEIMKDMVNYEPAKKIFSHFETLNGYQKSYQTQKNEVISRNASLKSLINISGVAVASQCFRNQKVNLTDLSSKVIYMNNILSLTDERSYNRLKEILGQFSEMKKSLLDAEGYAKEIASRRQRDTSGKSSPFLQLKDSGKLSDHLGNGMRILKHMAASLDHRDAIFASTKYNEKVNDFIKSNSKLEHVRNFWRNPTPKIERLVRDLEQLDEAAKRLREKDLMTVRQIFEEATKVQGIPEVFPYINQDLNQRNTDHMSAFNNTQILKLLDMDFSTHKGELNAASLSLDNIKEFFDDLFGLSPKMKENSLNLVTQQTSSTFVILACLAVLFFFVVLAFVAYGLTSTGKRQYKKLYFYHFGKPQDYEKRWRYSLFMDRLDGKNVLIDAVREINEVNLLNSIKKGAYINVCNKFGNTPLHVATKRGYVELVKILIKNGADRTFLNTQNKTPEQIIPENYHETEKEKIERFEKIEKLYAKYSNRKFKQRYPDEFPSSSFHIYIEERTEDTVTNAFTTKFQAITSDEVMPTTTHCIVKTTDEGILETDDINLLAWIFYGAIIVKDSWMTDCLKNNKLISKDFKYLVEKVKYKGVVFDTVTQWSIAMAKGTTPYLCGVHVVFVMKECPNVAILSAMITNQGGFVLDKFPEKENYNKGAHPYLHHQLGPIFIIHDGSADVSVYKKDVDRMFTVLTESEFLMFMLKREINLNTSPNPISVLVDGDD